MLQEKIEGQMASATIEHNESSNLSDKINMYTNLI